VERSKHTGPIVPVPPPDRGLPDKLDRAVSATRAAAKRQHWVMAVLTSRRFWFVIILIVIIAAFISIPRMFWDRAPELSLNIAVLDKTVPFTDYRAHRGLFWLLGQNKFIDDSSSGTARWYDEESDYVGFYPPDPESVVIEGEDFSEPQVTRGTMAFAAELPAADADEPEMEQDEQGPPPTEGEELAVKGDWRTDLLKVEELDNRDVLYIADTYGVYTGDYYERAGRETKVNDMIFGGLTESEVEAAEWFASQGRLIIGEFNSFASPTPPELRERIEHIFGVSWTGWSGRYFVNFADETDVPYWLREKWEADNGRSWDRSGAGYVLVNDQTGEYLFLREGIEVEREGLKLVPNERFIKLDAMQGVENCTFCYWFDIVEKEAGVDTLADFDLHLTSEGGRILAEHGIPGVFPAVTRVQRAFTPQGPESGPASATPAESSGPAEDSAEPDAAPTGGEALAMPEAGKADSSRRGHPRKVTESGEWMYLAYYMAGNMMDFKMDMGPHDTRLTMYINRSFYSQPVVGSQGYFFWHTYYPMVSNILRAEANRLKGVPKNVFLFD